MLKPCLDCGALSPDPRCGVHGRVVARARTHRKRAIRPYTTAEMQRRKQVVATHRHTYGAWCPGFHRPAHASSDLTADHITDYGIGGEEDGPLQVLCRSCNTRKWHYNWTQSHS